MPEMIATSEIEYPPGKNWQPGDRFEVEDVHVVMLEHLGRAKRPDDASGTITLRGVSAAAVSIGKELRREVISLRGRKAGKDS